MVSKDDWRLMGQEKWLKGVELHFQKWSSHGMLADNIHVHDHDHCAFCFGKLAKKEEYPEAADEGYTTDDEYHWVCEGCFEDFKEMFCWKVKG